MADVITTPAAPPTAGGGERPLAGRAGAGDHARDATPSHAADREPHAVVRADEPGTAGMLAYTFGVGSRGQTRIATVWTDDSHKRVTGRGAAYDQRGRRTAASWPTAPTAASR